jgi:hypothetical protein
MLRGEFGREVPSDLPDFVRAFQIVVANTDTDADEVHLKIGTPEKMTSVAKSETSGRRCVNC